MKNQEKVAAHLARIQKGMAAGSPFSFNYLYILIRYGQHQIAQKELEPIASRIQADRKALPEPGKKSTTDRSLMQDVGEIDFIKGLIAATADRKKDALSFFQLADTFDFPPRNSIQMQMLAEALFRLEEYKLAAQAYEVYLKHFPLDAFNMIIQINLVGTFRCIAKSAAASRSANRSTSLVSPATTVCRGAFRCER
jgi:tetratricopeptide (TPR) repeat protein